MADEQILTWIGNLTADPELRSTQQGVSVANFTIASTPRIFDRTANEWKDGEASFLRCAAWRELADHIGPSLKKGMRVIAQGKLSMKNYQDAQGNARTAWELEVTAIGPDLKYATAQVTRAGNGQGGGQQPQQQGAYGAPQGAYGPPQGQQMAPQQGGYPAPQGQQQMAPQQQFQQQPQQMQQPPAQQQAPQQMQQQQAQPQQMQQPQQQAQPQPGTQQAAQQGQWQQPGQGFADQTPF